MDLHVAPKISLSLVYVADVTQRVEKMARNSDALKRDGSVMAMIKVAFYPRGTSHLSDDTGVPGTGVEGSREADGLVSECQFQQPVGLCVELDSVVYF